MNKIKLLFTLCLVFLCTIVFAQSDVLDPLPSPELNSGSWLADVITYASWFFQNWEGIFTKLIYLLGLGEIILRMIPTKSNWAPLTGLIKRLEEIRATRPFFKNRKLGGGEIKVNFEDKLTE